MRPLAGLVVLAALVVCTQLPDGREPGPRVAMPSAGSLPRPDHHCAARADHMTALERLAENATANTTIPSGPFHWSMAPDTTRWTRWLAMRARVTGAYAGTTDRIFAWAGCKWALDADLLRAVAVQESDWRQAMVGDRGASFGIMQVKDHYDDGSPAWGGYPATLAGTALNVDFYAAYLRACLDGVFYDGGRWLYGGRRVADLSAEHGADYVTWGCVGSWYSGHWYDAEAQGYIDSVRARLATRAWTRFAPGSAEPAVTPASPVG